MPSRVGLKYVGETLRAVATELSAARERWHVERQSGAFTDAERVAVDTAFRKFDEGFAAIDQTFKGWR